MARTKGATAAKAREFKETVNIITNMMAISEEFLEKCIVRLYKRQTEMEKFFLNTVKKNFVGFRTGDARSLSLMAEDILTGKKLSPEKIEEARARMYHYRRQLAKSMMANA